MNMAEVCAYLSAILVLIDLTERPSLTEVTYCAY